MSFHTLQRAGFMLPTRLKNSYEGAGDGRRAQGWDAPASGPATSSAQGNNTLRNRARAATRNDPYAFSAIDHLVSNTIGTGITPKPTHPDKRICSELQQLWDDWCVEADAAGHLDFYGLQAMVARAVYESGECFIRLCPRSLRDGLAVPLQLQVMEADFVPTHETRSLEKGHRLCQGIELNAHGQRVAYWMHSQHPGENSQLGSYNKLVRVPAEYVVHVFEASRPGQLRGVTSLAPVLLRLKTLDSFDDALLFRQQVANLFAGFITKPAPDAHGSPLAPPGAAESLTRDFTPMVGIELGTVQELLPGETLSFTSPPDAGNNYPDFMRQQLQAVASGIGVPYEILTGDLRNVNDRVIRVVLNEFRRRIEQRQHDVFVHQLCRPIHAAWLDMAVLSGAIDLPGYAQSPRPYRRTRWVPQGWAYIHPVQDVEADKLAVRAGFTSRGEVILKRGNDPETIDAEIAADNQRADGLGLRHDTDSRFRDEQGELIQDDSNSTPEK